MINPLDCLANQPQEFLICTTVYRAKDLPIFNTDTYVKVILGKHTKKTKTFQNSENPHYNEYFVFELFCTVPHLLRYTIQYEVKKKGTCKKQLVLGDLHIDLTTIWNSPTHGFYKKWGKLNNSIADVSSYLLIDLSVVVKNEKLYENIEPVIDNKFENNILLPHKTASNVKYSLLVYRGVFLRKTDYILNIAIAGCSVSLADILRFFYDCRFQARLQTKKSTQNPVWNKEIQLVWSYPTLSPSIHINLMASEYLQSKLISEFDIQMNDISYGGKLLRVVQ